MAARKKLIIPFLLPSVLMISLFFIYPAIQTVIISFQDWHGTFRTFGWNGLANYQKLFTDPNFRRALPCSASRRVRA